MTKVEQIQKLEETLDRVDHEIESLTKYKEDIEAEIARLEYEIQCQEYERSRL